MKRRAAAAVYPECRRARRTLERKFAEPARARRCSGGNDERRSDMRVSEAMTRDVVLVNPDQSIAEAAAIMEDCDIGSLPVADGDRLVGMITDRDIAVRAVARGMSSETPVSEVMSKEVLYCFDDDEVPNVAKNMSDIQVRRLPVVNRDKKLVGILSLGDLARKSEPKTAGEAMKGIAEPSEQHSQTAGAH
jgi:CBS domain-containing protein